jgi:hypothetical protein
MPIPARRDQDAVTAGLRRVETVLERLLVVGSVVPLGVPRRVFGIQYGHRKSFSGKEKAAQATGRLVC